MLTAMPGNPRKGGKDLEKKVEHECKDGMSDIPCIYPQLLTLLAISTPSTGKIFSKSNEFKAK
jgi:hypothetical protein